MTIGLVWALLLTSGMRVYVHSHPTGFTPEAEHAHVHVGSSDTSVSEVPDGAAGPVDVSFSAILKLFSFFPAFALLGVLLLLALAGDTGMRTRRLISARFRYRDPPHLAPPGRGPPQ